MTLVARILKLGRSASWQAEAMALFIRADSTSALVLSSTGAAGTDCLSISEGIFGGSLDGRGGGVFLGFLAACFAISAKEGGDCWAAEEGCCR